MVGREGMATPGESLAGKQVSQHCIQERGESPIAVPWSLRKEICDIWENAARVLECADRWATGYDLENGDDFDRSGFSTHKGHRR